MKKTAEIEMLWFDEEGRGPWIPKCAVGVFDYPAPGPEAHVGLRVPGFGGSTMESARARELAAELVKAADEVDALNMAKRGGL